MNPFKPKRAFESVVQELVDGLEDGALDMNPLECPPFGTAPPSAPPPPAAPAIPPEAMDLQAEVNGVFAEGMARMQAELTELMIAAGQVPAMPFRG